MERERAEDNEVDEMRLVADSTRMRRRLMP